MQTDTQKHAGDKVYREVKKCADNGDIRGLRYIFLSCLDVDPTFKEYERAYEDYQNTPELFVEHTDENLMKLKENNVDDSWNLEYWNQLKKDLLENFSQKRFEHMREVAKVVYKDKICRIEEKRHQPDKTHVTTVEEKKQNEGSIGAALKSNANNEAQRLIQRSINEQLERESRDKERKQKESEENNARIEMEEQQKAAERRKRMQSYSVENGSGGGVGKKVMGVVLAIVAVMVIVFMIISII